MDKQSIDLFLWKNIGKTNTEKMRKNAYARMLGFIDWDHFLKRRYLKKLDLDQVFRS